MELWPLWASKQQVHRLSLALISFLVCIVFFYQSFASSSSASGSWLWTRQLQHEEPSSVISARNNDSSLPLLKAPVELVTAAAPNSSIDFSSSQASVIASQNAPEIAPISSAIEPNEAKIAPIPSSSLPIDENAPRITSEAEAIEQSATVVFNASIAAEKSLTNSSADQTFAAQHIVKKQREIPEWRASLEQQLRSAKHEIDSANPSTMQLDPQVTKSIYINAHKFFKSYELMENIFKVYMYKEGEARLVHRGPLTGIYSSEGRFIHEMNQNSRFLTDDPQEAHMFFLPYSVAHMVLDLYVPGSHSMLPLATFIKDYVNLIASKHPFWNLTRGSDHFFVSCHDWGPATARDHPELRANAVKVVCNADLTEEFVPEKDASLPETYLHTVKLPSKLGGPGPAKRQILAFFAGQMHGRVRPGLIQQWKDKDPDMKIYEVIPREIAKKTSYVQHMRSSKFCICAMGYEVNSPRIVESIYYDCVPVIVADNFVLPFSDVLNWDAFSLTVKEKDLGRLKEILVGVSDEQYRKMQSRLKKVRKHFLWHDSGERFDLFHMVLHSVWMRRLQQTEKIVRYEMGEMS